MACLYRAFAIDHHHLGPPIIITSKFGLAWDGDGIPDWHHHKNEVVHISKGCVDLPLFVLFRPWKERRRATGRLSLSSCNGKSRREEDGVVVYSSRYRYFNFEGQRGRSRFKNSCRQRSGRNVLQVIQIRVAGSHIRNFQVWGFLVYMHLKDYCS